MTNIQEIWKPIKNYEGLYEISNLGRVRTTPRIDVFNKKCPSRPYSPKGKIMAQTIRNGYKSISLVKDEKSTNFYIHRLIGQHFIQNPQNKRTINHKNGIKTDNSIENLEWSTQRENNIHAINTKLRVHKRRGMRHTAKKVKLYNTDTNSFVVYDCILDLSEELKINPRRVSEIISGKIKNKIPNNLKISYL